MSSMAATKKLSQLFHYKSVSKETFLSVENIFGKVDTNCLSQLFSRFDKDSDGYLGESEYENLKSKWLLPLIELPRRCALVIVDFQNDFISGSLAIKDGPAKEQPEDAIPHINHLLDTRGDDFVKIIYTLDWHPPDHISFYENVQQRKLSLQCRGGNKIKIFDTVKFEDPCVEQILWPSHCIQNTWGSQLHPDLCFHKKGMKIFKGVHSEIDSYSAFCDNHGTYCTELDAELKKATVSTVFLCGLAYDVCVAATATDALQLGYNTAIIEDCSKGLERENMELVRQKLLRSHGVILNSSDVHKILTGEMVPWSWAAKLASTV